MTARRAVIPVFIPHLGCPRDCVFCNQRSIAAPSEPRPEEIGAFIAERLAYSGDGAELAFFGGSFTAISPVKRRAYLEAAYPFVASDRLSGIRLSTRPDAIDETILAELKSFGVTTIELGAQSMDDGLLERANRGHTAADTVRASGLIKDAGFTLILQMMLGLPGDDGHSFETARQIAALRPDGVRIYPTVVIRHTRLEEMWRKGEYTPLTVEKAAEICAELIDFFENQNIRVIRAGLNPTEELGGEVVAGPYHPAFGELCRSRIYMKKAEALLCGTKPGDTLIFETAPGRAPLMIGQHRCNFTAITEKYAPGLLKCTERDMPDGALRLLRNGEYVC